MEIESLFSPPAQRSFMISAFRHRRSFRIADVCTLTTMMSGIRLVYPSKGHGRRRRRRCAGCCRLVCWRYSKVFGSTGCKRWVGRADRAHCKCCHIRPGSVPRQTRSYCSLDFRCVLLQDVGGQADCIRSDSVKQSDHGVGQFRGCPWGKSGIIAGPTLRGQHGGVVEEMGLRSGDCKADTEGDHPERYKVCCAASAQALSC